MGSLIENSMSEVAVEARSLVKTFSEKKIINNISLQVKKGEFFGLLGNTQSGKTTLMRLLYCNLIPDQGSLYVLGKNVYSNVKKVKEEIGILPQKSNLDLDLNLLEGLINFANYFGISKKRALIQIEKFLKPMGLEEFRFSDLSSLSEGVKRRLSFLRAQINSPHILFLDEPTSDLDGESKSLLWDQLKIKKREKKTIVFSTRSIEEAEKFCDQVALIHQGKILIQGPPLKLLEDEIGIEVCKLELRFSDLSYYEKRIEGRFVYRIFENKIFIFLRSKDERKQIKKIFSDQKLNFDRPSLEDLFIKQVGFKSWKKERGWMK